MSLFQNVPYFSYAAATVVLRWSITSVRMFCSGFFSHVKQRRLPAQHRPAPRLQHDLQVCEVGVDRLHVRIATPNTASK